MGLCSNLAIERVGALRLRTAVTVPALAKVRTAVQLMRQYQLGCVFVVDRFQRPMGTFDERTLIRLLSENPAALDETLWRHLETPANCVCVNEPVGEALECVTQREMRFLGVVDDKQTLLALTGEKGMVEFVADHFPAQLAATRSLLEARRGCSAGGVK